MIPDLEGGNIFFCYNYYNRKCIKFQLNRKIFGYQVREGRFKQKQDQISTALLILSVIQLGASVSQSIGQ